MVSEQISNVFIIVKLWLNMNLFHYFQLTGLQCKSPDPHLW